MDHDTLVWSENGTKFGRAITEMRQRPVEELPSFNVKVCESMQKMMMKQIFEGHRNSTLQPIIYFNEELDRKR